jgi:putative endonuclease
MYYTYILESVKNRRRYTGYTKDLRKRFLEHNKKKGNKYTNKGAPYKLVYYEACIDKNDAKSRESYLKSGPGKRYIAYRLKSFLSLTG